MTRIYLSGFMRFASSAFVVWKRARSCLSHQITRASRWRNNAERDEAEELDDAGLLAELGIDAAPAEGDIENLRHVKTRAEVRAAEEVGKRKPCEDFEIYKPRFSGVVKDIKSGNRRTIAFRKNAGFTKTDIKQEQFIILEGQTCFIAEIGEPLTAPNGEYDARLRVIYDNGTEGDILLRTLIRAMYRDDACRLISTQRRGRSLAAMQQKRPSKWPHLCASK